MSKKTGISFFVLFLAVSNVLLGLVSADLCQAQEIDEQQTVDKSMQFLQMQMAEHLKMRRPASTAPNLIGKWQGEAPNLGTTGDCNVDTVLVIIAKQCSSLMNGSIKVDNDTAIPVVGAYYNNGRVILNGNVVNGSSYKFVMLTGKYTNSSNGRIKVQSFTYYANSAFNNIMYDIFSLAKQ